MKKLTKILATVLTMAMAMSTVVMAAPIDSSKIVEEYNFMDASQCSTFTPSAQYGTSSIADGLGGKDVTDKVAYTYGGSSGHHVQSNATTSGDILTFEASVYITGSTHAQLYNATNDGGARYGLKLQSGKLQIVTCNGWTYEDVAGYTAVDMSVWHKMAIEINSFDDKYYFYFDGVKVGEKSATLDAGTRTKDIRFAGTAYVDNYRVYTQAYDPNRDVMPATGVDETLVADTMTVSQVKAALMEGQDAAKAEVRVYKDGVGGTMAENSDVIKSGWKAVITSLSGDLYSTVYTVQSSVSVSNASYANNAVTATVTNNTNTPISSMMMVLVQNGGKIVMASEAQTDIEATATFTISGVDSLSNPEIFFVKSWDDLAPIVDSLTPVVQ